MQDHIEAAIDAIRDVVHEQSGTGVVWGLIQDPLSNYTNNEVVGGATKVCSCGNSKNNLHAAISLVCQMCPLPTPNSYS